MRIIDGLHYHYKLDQMIQECCEQAKNHPFESYFFIVDQPQIVEKLFFKYTDYLVNIQVISFNDFLHQLISENRLTRHTVLTHTEFVYQLRYILRHIQLSCFTNQQIYPLIDKFIPLLRAYDINAIEYQEDIFCNQPKLKDFINIYQALKARCDQYTHLSLESILDNCDFLLTEKKHIYIEGDHLYQEKRQNLMKRLSKHHDMTVIYTHLNDKRLFNIPYHQFCQQAQTITETNELLDHLFLQAPQTCSQENNYYTFVSPTLHQEVKRVVYNIYQKIADEQLHYSDFMIVYPDTAYIDILLTHLNTLHIPHNLAMTQLCLYDYSYQIILKSIDSIEANTIHEFAEVLDQNELELKYHQYLQSLFIYDDEISNQDFKAFFVATCQLHKKETMNNQDHISVCSIEQAQTETQKYIYILGMNETILPRAIKDTGLLLDEDIDSLRKHHIPTPLTTLEQLGVHNNDILKLLNQPNHSMTFSYSLFTLSGESLLPSSLYKQLKQMFKLKNEPLYQFLPIDEYYQKGGEYQSKETLNQHILDYQQSKNQPVTLSDDVISNLYSSTLSVSQIETYNKCPFAYFIQYGLKAYPLHNEKLMPNELGSLIHYVLSVCIDQDRDIAQLVNDYLSQDKTLLAKIQSSSLNIYFIEQLKKDLQTTIQMAKKHLALSDFSVLTKEKEVNGNILGIDFKGFVDRIDEYHEKISIIDYKSSAKDIDLNLAMQGFHIQMLLYLKMVIESYHKEPAAVLYFNTKKRILALDQSLKDEIDENEFYKQYRYGGYVIDDETHKTIHALDKQMDRKSNIINVRYVKTKDEYKGQLLTRPQLDILLKKIEEHIYQLYERICKGDITITPKGSDQSTTHALINPCRYCLYHSVCNFDVFYNDYVLVNFLDVEKILGGDQDAL